MFFLRRCWCGSWTLGVGSSGFQDEALHVFVDAQGICSVCVVESYCSALVNVDRTIAELVKETSAGERLKALLIIIFMLTR